MSDRAFSQSSSLDLARLVSAATTHFGVDVEVLSSTPGSTRVRVRHPAGHEGVFTLAQRPTEPRDLEDAERAEQRGKAAGMAALARRCPTVFDVRAEPAEASAEAARFALFAALSTVTLGPVLPGDGATLLGIRSSLSRLEACLKGR